MIGKRVEVVKKSDSGARAGGGGAADEEEEEEEEGGKKEIEHLRLLFMSNHLYMLSMNITSWMKKRGIHVCVADYYFK